MTEFVFEDCCVQVDAEATRAYYDAYGEIAGGCGCAYCRNFAAAVETVAPRLRAFLDRLGLDIRKPREVMELGPGPEGRRLYEAFYHLVGRLKGRNCSGIAAEGAQMVFCKDCDLLPDNFPKPCFQINVALELPWLLKETVPETPSRKSSLQENEL